MSLPSWQPQFQNACGFGLLESILYPDGYIRQSLYLVYRTNCSPLVSAYLYALDSGTEITSQNVSVKKKTKQKKKNIIILPALHNANYSKRGCVKAELGLFLLSFTKYSL